MKNFRNMKVWEKAHLLVLKVYQTTVSFPKEELYGLTSQMRRSSASIPTNIAEGCGRDKDTEFRYFLQIAMGSASELEYLFILAEDLKLINKSKHEEITNDIIEIKRMLAALIQKLKADS